jgi:hypothetical protein
MSAPGPIATLSEVAKLLSSLFGREVTAARASTPFTVHGCAVFAHEARMMGVWGFDLPAAASAAAALSLVPPAVAAEAVRAGALPPHLEENLHEVMNVGSRLFAMDGVRTTLTEMRTGPAARQLLDGARGERLDFRFEVQGYPAGRMCLCAASGRGP